MNRKIYYWKLRDLEMQLGERTLIMGVLNITPDSFSDGGRFNDPDRAYARALELEEQGADIIDIGAESTKPGSHRISADEEWQRLVPVLKRLSGNLRAPLSLDTYKSLTAERALDYGVEIFNDPSGLTFDPELARVAANANAGLILNHMRGTPETWAKLPPMQDTMGSIARELEATINRARHAGVERGRVVIDPGLGFGKRKEQNAEILGHLKELAGLDYPILVGPSRKSFLAQSTEGETLFATAAAVTAAVLNGAHIVRVHDVGAMKAAIQVAEEIARAAVPKVAPEEERRATRPRNATPNIEAERPRPPRPPLRKPPVPPPAPPTVTELAEPAGDFEDVAIVPDVPVALPPPPPKREYRPAAAARPFERKPAERKPYVRRDDRGDDRRPSRGPDRGDDRRPARSSDRPPRPADRGASRPPYSKDGPPGKPFNSGPPRGDRFKPSGPPRSGPPRSGPPRGDGFKPSGPPRSGPPRGDRFKPTGPPRSFDRGGDRGRPPRSDGPPRPGSRPGGGRPPAGRPPAGGGDRPPKRPFRKRP
jgi:dihydropteroate synthase